MDGERTDSRREVGDLVYTVTRLTPGEEAQDVF